MLLKLAGMVIALALYSACAADGLLNSPDPFVDVAVSPTSVASGDSIRVTVNLSNRTAHAQTYNSGTACYLDFEVRDSVDRPIGHGVEGCIAIVVGPFTLLPGASKSRSFTWRAQVRDTLGVGSPAPPGVYTVYGLAYRVGEPALRSSPVGLRVLGP